MLTLVTSWYGALLLDEKGAVVRRTLFPGNADDLSTVLLRLDAGEVLPEERDLAPDDGVAVVEERLLKLPGARLVRDGPALAWAREAADAKGEHGADPAVLHAAMLRVGRAKVKAAAGSPDQHVMQVVDTIDELSAQANVLVERLREWYALHYPELVHRIERHEELAAVVAKHGTRDAIREARTEYAGIDSPMGADITDAEAEAYRGLARSASSLYSTRAELEKYLDETMPRVAPNVTALVGAVLAARLVRHAGGIRKLATMPSGTIQTLGAEKALFRHIREGKAPPKHGIIFQHASLHSAPRWQRGSLARALAGKIALAARADALTGATTLGATLTEEYRARSDVIRREHAKPRPRAGRGGRAPPRGGGGGRGPGGRGRAYGPGPKGGPKGGRGPQKGGGRFGKPGRGGPRSGGPRGGGGGPRRGGGGPPRGKGKGGKRFGGGR